MDVTTFSRRQMPTDGLARGIHYLVFMISRSDPLELIVQDSVKDEVYIPPMPVTLNNLKGWIIKVTAKTEQPSLQNSGTKLKIVFMCVGQQKKHILHFLQ